MTEGARFSRGRTLTSAWIAGGDTSRPLPAGMRPWVDGSKVAIPCTVTRCGSTLYAWPDENAAARLTDHLRIHHGQSWEDTELHPGPP
jgi:hypothetical protein